ncbi:MAG: Gfo/Idh/MocA family oxidoreductase [bacterium]
MSRAGKTTRRRFLLRSGQGLGAALIGPHVFPARALGRGEETAPSERVTMGFIGLGTMAKHHLFSGAWAFLPGGYVATEDVQILAVSDVWRDRREEIQLRINQEYSERLGKGNYKSCEVYNDFRDLLARDDIDAVLIATPIHWHATMAIMAAKAGKDVYCEKPTAVAIHESQAVVKAVQQNERVFQGGTQQRSEFGGKFRLACELVRSGRIGELRRVYACRDGGGAVWPVVSGEEKSVPIPDGFDWDLWLGPAPNMPYQGKSDAHLFGFGGINWGQHHYDTVQWALDADRTGPIEIFLDDGNAAYRYANGVEVYGRMYAGEKVGETGGAWFVGTEGRIGVDRETLVAEPTSILDKPLGPDDVHLYKNNGHSRNFLECVKTRKQTICDVETAHRAASLMLLGGLALRLKRTLNWDPSNEQFINDDEANQLLSLSKRDPWKV